MSGLLKRGSRGTDVARLQAELNQHVKPQPMLDVDGVFGAKTEDTVRIFQRRQGLTVDGIVGSDTWAEIDRLSRNAGGPGIPGALAAAAAVGVMTGTSAAIAAATAVLDLPATDHERRQHSAGQTSAVAELATQIALTQTHVREQPEGSNRGPEVDAYARAAGEEPPILWCMAFVYWAFEQASGRLGTSNPLVGVPAGQRDYVTGVYAWANRQGLTVNSPIRGDIFCVRGGSNGRTHQHTGIVTQVNGGTISTIEGNTNNDGSSNGIGVFARSRSTSNLDFIRLS